MLGIDRNDVDRAAAEPSPVGWIGMRPIESGSWACGGKERDIAVEHSNSRFPQQADVVCHDGLEPAQLIDREAAENMLRRARRCMHGLQSQWLIGREPQVRTASDLAPGLGVIGADGSAGWGVGVEQYQPLDPFACGL